MTIASRSQPKTTEQSLAENGTNPTKTPEWNPIVVLVRLPYLPQQGFSAPRYTEHPIAVPSPPVSSSIDQTESASKDQAADRREPGFASVISNVRARVVRIFTEVAEKPKKKRLSPAAWKMAGLAVTIVLIFVALALLNGAVDPDVELASRASPESTSEKHSGHRSESWDTPPKLILAPKSTQVGKTDKQPAKLTQQESIAVESEEGMSADRSQIETAVVDAKVESEEGMSADRSQIETAVVDAKVDAKEESPADPAEKDPADSEAKDQVVEVEPPNLEPMTTTDESVAVQNSPVASRSDEIPELTETTTDVQIPEMQMTAQQMQNAPDRVTETAPVQPTYPLTDPSTHQYPSRYENLLSNAAKGISDESYPMSNPQTSIYGWQPSTVRLQPRIEPPPIR